MRFGLLGPFEVRRGAEEIEIAAPKQRAVLALLVLHRGEPVSVDRLATELWGDEPPATATKTVQVYIAQLRKSLGDGVLITQGRGYLLQPNEDQVDVDRFEQLAAKGRRELEDGDATAAASLFRDALGLWRGPPLADFAYEEFAQPEITRLEEERLSVLELRIEADLALGRHEGLVSELRGLVQEFPLRERLRGQLILALYRCGRQAEALEEYQLARKTLLDELGLEPSRALQELERAILAQEESLGAPTAFRRLQVRRRRRGAVLLVVGGVLVAASAAAALTIRLTGGGGGVAPIVEGNSVAAIDPATGRITATFPVGASPAAVSTSSGKVWVVSVDDRTITRIDPRNKSTRTIGIAAVPTDLVADGTGVWVGTGGHLEHAQFAGTAATSITRLDPRTGSTVATIRLPSPGRYVSNLAANHLAVAAGSLWAISPGASVVRIDPRSNRVVSTARALPPVSQALTGAGRAIWVLDDTGTISRLDAHERVTATVKIASSPLTGLAVGDGSVWATAPYDGTLWRVALGRKIVQRTIDVGIGADAVAFGHGYVWVTNSLSGTLTRVDPETNRVDRTISIGNTPRAVAVTDESIWVAVAGGADTPPVARGRRGDVVPLAETLCGQVFSGAQPPRFLVVSDLPLQGGPRFGTLQMSQAILSVLRRHHFRAGRYPLAYQSCDDSTAQTGLFDPVKCAANAKAYVANPGVLGVIGPYNSGCAYEEIPIANQAGLGIISPTTTDPGLTRLAFLAPRNGLQALYPTGRRTFARLLSPDDAEAAGAAVLAKRLGARRVYVLNDGGYGTALAFYYRRAAQKLGQEVAGYEGWNPKEPLASELAKRVAQANVDAVYLCGLIDTDVGAVLSALKRALPPRTPLIGCSGLLPASLLFEQIGQAARGTYVALQGLVAERLPTVGKKFVHDFGATQSGQPVHLFSVYAAQSTEVLLDAIARSDGTRASVARELLRTRVQDGILGNFVIDPTGDASPAPITILRLERPGRSNTVLNYEGARIDRVINPDRRLLQPNGS